MLEKGKKIILNKKEYIIEASYMFNNENYVLVVELKNINHHYLCKYDGKDSLEEVTDDKITSQILDLYLKDN